MKSYFRYTRRSKEGTRYLVLGIVFIGLGICAWFVMEDYARTAWMVILVVFGALLATLPQLLVWAKYGVKEDGYLHYSKAGIPRKYAARDVKALLICTFDEYAGSKGYVPVQVEGAHTSEGAVYLPAVLALREDRDDNLDLCLLRSQARLAQKKNMLFDGVLEFDFLTDMTDAGFSGKYYISETIYETYRPGFDSYIEDPSRIEVFDNTPREYLKMQREMRKQENQTDEGKKD